MMQLNIAIGFSGCKGYKIRNDIANDKLPEAGNFNEKL
jgi:hypothetical protein